MVGKKGTIDRQHAYNVAAGTGQIFYLMQWKELFSSK